MGGSFFNFAAPVQLIIVIETVLATLHLHRRRRLRTTVQTKLANLSSSLYLFIYFYHLAMVVRRGEF